MFELSIALRYLIPKKRSLSTALVSLLSVFLISLVVWLVLVFLSVTRGIERAWLTKLTSLHAPIRITPTQEYYHSYYYLIDNFSAASNYTLKTIGEKEISLRADPYSEEIDAELPLSLGEKASIDPVKTAYQELHALGLAFQDYEISGALLRLNRDGATTLSQMSYLLSAPLKNPRFQSLIIESKEFDGHTVLLPKNYKESGIKMGDFGTLNYMAATAASSQEQKIPIRVGGFYDPGLLSIGNKCVIVPVEITRAIHASHQTISSDGAPTNGIFVWFDDLDKAPELQQEILARFEKAGIAKYWKVDTFREFEFAKDLLLQFQSDRTLLLFIATLILLVACSNILSLLILLVHDKQKEIAILAAMGAPPKSIAAIFALSGAMIGFVSALIGCGLALLTLKYLSPLISFLGILQGHHPFNPAFFGNSMPNALSMGALLFVLIATPLLSVFAGLIPALKASRVRPSAILRSE